MFYNQSPVGDSNEIIAKLKSLGPGEQLVYHRGLLGRGMQVGRIADEAYILAVTGRLFLTQRRLGPPLKEGLTDWKDGIGKGFEYIATGAKTPTA